MIIIVNYGMGNLGSVENMLKKIGAQVKISADLQEIANADKLILPGVGSFDNGMSNLHELGFIPLLRKKVLLEKTPILGICLGMQLFTRLSEEGSMPGLGWINAETIRFSFEKEFPLLKVPHMGWNTVKVKRAGFILDEYCNDSRFYFVHSYFVRCNNEENVLATTKYGIEFHSAIVQDNIIGTQFHPEKSHKFGLMVLRRFVEMKIC